jgi:hypothetical protein
MHRKHFIKQLTFVGLSIQVSRTFQFDPGELASKKPVRIGWITDVHHGYCRDADVRLENFIREANDKKPDFIIQGGDFCHPTVAAGSFMKIWEGFGGEKYHVLGNHDMDKGSKRDIMDLWQMKKPYYAFDKDDFHFIVMDCNHILKDGKYLDYEKANFYIDSASRDLVNPEQIGWLEEEIRNTKKQCIIISHQSFDEVWAGHTVPNKLAIRKVIDDANTASKFKKVIACFCGHHHLDNHMVLNGVHYFHINSASYYYVGDGFGSDGGMAMYTDPLYCFVTIDPKGKIIIEGKDGHFISPTPIEKNYPDAKMITASIQNRTVKIK